VWCRLMRQMASHNSLTKLGRIKDQAQDQLLTVLVPCVKPSIVEEKKKKIFEQAGGKRNEETSNGTCIVDRCLKNNWDWPTGFHPQRAAGELPSRITPAPEDCEFYMCGRR